MRRVNINNNSKERIDVQNLTEKQLKLIAAVIEKYVKEREEFLKNRLKMKTDVECKNLRIFMDEDYWEEFKDPETGLLYDVNVWTSDDIVEVTHATLYNVIKSPHPQYMTTDTSESSEQKIWSSDTMAFSKWLQLERAKINERMTDKKSSFTTGPWHCDTSDEGHVVFDPNAGTICVIPIDLQANKANAHLIAAAPDLYNVLKELCTEPVLSPVDTWIKARVLHKKLETKLLR